MAFQGIIYVVDYWIIAVHKAKQIRYMLLNDFPVMHKRNYKPVSLRLE